MTKACIIGCGKMADQHAVQILRVKGAEIAGVCDSEPLMARQMAERFSIGRYFTDVRDMLETTRPDVVHITTPPQSHFELGEMCFEAGCNVYMEKPFTIDASEAEALISLADQHGLKITAGHNHLFTHAMVRARELVRQGYLGGRPVHMESHYCYSFGDAAYAKALLGDSGHWVRRLPGSLLQNIISHGISWIAEYLTGDNPTVIAHGFTSEFLKSIGQDDIIDEVRVIIHDEDSTTAYFTFSSQIRPVLQQIRLCGRKNSMLVDNDRQVVIRDDDKGYKSYVRYFVPPVGYAKQYLDNLRVNFGKFLKNDFHMPNDAGLKTLIESFYGSLNGEGPLPLPYREIVLTTRIMDEIFRQIRSQSPQPVSRSSI